MVYGGQQEWTVLSWQSYRKQFHLVSSNINSRPKIARALNPCFPRASPDSL